MNIEVIDWISYDYADKMGYDVPIGGMGGYFNFVDKGLRWKDFIDIWKDAPKPYAEAIRKSILESESKMTGWEHQNSEKGVPFFNDGKVGSFSMRGWGDIMAAIWSEKEDKDYTYMDFYM